MPTSFDHSDSDSSSDVSSKFWARPSRQIQSPEVSDEGHVIINTKEKWKGDLPFSSTVERDHDPFNLQGQLVNVPNSRQRQTKMLLVSMIETFCRTYGESPDTAQKTFIQMCQTLRSIGFIDAEFVDEVASVRSTFSRAFQNLFFTALQNVRKQDAVQSQRIPKRITVAPWKSSPSYADDSVGQDLLFTEDRRNPVLDIPFHDLNVQNSRYCNDFFEIGLLGKGGFASVWKVRNKLEGIEYAVKKVRLETDLVDAASDEGDNPYEKIFREIKHLARLEHKNVIRYYSSWLEYDVTTQTRFVDTPSEGSVSDVWDTDASNTPAPSCKSNDQLLMENCSSNENLVQVEFVENDIDTEDHRDTRSRLAISRHTKAPNTSNHISVAAYRAARTSWTLFIQMQICPFTLYDYIKQRNDKLSTAGSGCFDLNLCFKLFSEILEGTAYIHKQNLIHRDLKPSNIFLIASNEKRESTSRDDSRKDPFVWKREAWTPKIGDFGLATVFDEETRDTALMTKVRILQTERTSRESMTTGVGTRAYASPEQLAAPLSSYNEKSDIYSLGIIFFELCCPFATAMERAFAMDQLKRGKFSDEFVEKHPKESTLILWMMKDNPSHRPTARQLLDSDLFSRSTLNDQVNVHTQLQLTSLALESKAEEVAKLQMELERLKCEHAEEIQKLQQKLKQLQTSNDSVPKYTNNKQTA